MAKNTETDQAEWDDRLHDVMGDIFKYLNVTDLNNASKVSTSWQRAVMRERTKRFYIQHARLSCHSKLKTSSLKVLPHASLLIYDCDLEAKEFIRRCFRERLPRKVIALKVNKYLTLQDKAFAVVSDNEQNRNRRQTSNFDILALFFPSIQRRARVDVVWESPESSLLNMAGRIDYLTKELRIRKDSWSALLFFTYSRQGYEIANALTRISSESSSRTVWTGTFQEQQLTVRSSRDDYTIRSRSLVAIRIAGPGVRAWGTTIDSRLPPDEFDRRLEELGRRVARKRHCTGLFYSPAVGAHGDCRGIARSVGRVFPGVPFVGMFNSRLWSGADVFLDSPDDSYYKAMNCMSIIVISYD